MRYSYTIAAQYDLSQIDAQVRALSLPSAAFQGCCSSGTTVEVVFAAALSAANKATLDTSIAAYLYSAAYQTGQQRAAAVTLAAAIDPPDKLLRAVLLALLDEVNTVRTHTGLPALTVAQVKAAVVAKVNSGAAD